MATPEPGTLYRFGVPGTGNPGRSEEVRNNLDALAQSHLTSDEDFPDSTQRRDGMVRVNQADPNNVKWQVFFDAAWRTLVQKLQLGIPAPAKLQLKFDPVPATAAWTIDHNLGSEPLVQVYDLTWRQLRVVPPAFEERNQLLAHVSSTVLGVLPSPGPPTPVRISMPLSHAGAILSVFAVVDEPIVGGPVDVELAINGTPLTGGKATVAPGPIGTVFPGTAVTAGNVFAAADTLDVILTAATPATGAIDVWAVVQRGLNADEYLLTHATENRVVITHPAPRTGYAIILG